ncbi:hypothetical protein [Nostoc sp.]
MINNKYDQKVTVTSHMSSNCNIHLSTFRLTSVRSLQVLLLDNIILQIE